MKTFSFSFLFLGVLLMSLTLNFLLVALQLSCTLIVLVVLVVLVAMVLLQLWSHRAILKCSLISTNFSWSRPIEKYHQNLLIMIVRCWIFCLLFVCLFVCFFSNNLFNLTFFWKINCFLVTKFGESRQRERKWNITINTNKSKTNWNKTKKNIEQT